MSCPGLHCPGCGDSGGGVVIVAALAVAAEVIIDAFWWLLAGTIAAAVISLAVVILLTRATSRREATFAAQLAARRPIAVAATATPQVSQGTAPAIEQHVHHHYHVADGQNLARVVAGEVLP